MKFKNFILGLGIFVVYALALFQGLETFYPTPQGDDFCSNQWNPVPFKDPVGSSCPNPPIDLQSRAESCWNTKGQFIYEYDSNSCPVGGYCDGCSIDYEAALDKHSNRVFIISIIIGIVVFIAGFFLLSTEPVGSALMAGGIWSVFYGVMKNWRNFSQSWKFLLLFVLLIVLIWVALRFNKKGNGFSGLKSKFKR